jgi:flagellar hook assembly protein FlgD
MENSIKSSQVKNRERVMFYPNPFNPECYILVNAKGKMKNVKCKIYNILGQLVREIESSRVQGFKDSRVYWDGKDSRGMEVPNGIYFYEIGEEKVRRMVVLR